MSWGVVESYIFIRARGHVSPIRPLFHLQTGHCVWEPVEIYIHKLKFLQHVEAAQFLSWLYCAHLSIHIFSLDVALMLKCRLTLHTRPSHLFACTITMRAWIPTRVCIEVARSQLICCPAISQRNGNVMACNCAFMSCIFTRAHESASLISHLPFKNVLALWFH